MATRLVNLFVKNVAAVDRAANKRTFLVMKGEAMTYDEALMSRRLYKVYEALGERYGSLMETIESIRASDETNKGVALKAAITAFINDMKKDVPSILEGLDTDVEKAGKKISSVRMSKLKTLYKVLSDIIAEGEEDMTEKTALDAGALSKMGHAIAAMFSKVAGADDATIAALEKAAGVEPEVNPEIAARLAKSEADHAAQVAKAAAENVALLARLEKAEAATAELREQAELRKFAEEVSGFTGIGMDPTKDAALLKSVTEKLPAEQAARFREILKAAVAQAAASKLFGEIGSSVSGVAAGSAAEDVQKAVGELMQKNDKLSVSDAQKAVFQANPGLYEKWRSETTLKV